MDGEGYALAEPQHTELALPAEVWYEVAMWLDPKSLAFLSLVSRFFGLGVCRQPSIWRHLFRRELALIAVPTLVVHGDRDVSAPLALTGEPTATLIPRATLVVYEGAPHGLFVTHMDRLTRDVAAFARG